MSYGGVSQPAEQSAELKGDLASLETLLNSSEGLLSRKHVSIPVTEQTIANAYLDHEYAMHDDRYGEEYATIQLTPRAMYQLYTECIIPDLQDGTLGRLYITDDDAYANEVYNLTINMELYDLESAAKTDYHGNLWEYFFTHPTIYSARTNAWLTGHGVRLETIAVARSAIDQRNQELEQTQTASPTDLIIDEPEATDEPAYDPESGDSRIVIDVPVA